LVLFIFVNSYYSGYYFLGAFWLKYVGGVYRGSNLTFAFPSNVSSSQVKQISGIFTQNKIKLQGITTAGNQVLIKSQPVDEEHDY